MDDPKIMETTVSQKERIAEARLKIIQGETIDAAIMDKEIYEWLNE